MAIHFRHGPDSIEGGGDIIISLTPAESAAVGGEAGVLADWFDTALWALAVLRSGHTVRNGPERQLTAEDLYTVINDLDHRLLPRLEGIRDAAVRQHQALGGSVGQLANAMDVARSTAQYRRDVLARTSASTWETWATRGRPQTDATDQD